MTNAGTAGSPAGSRGSANALPYRGRFAPSPTGDLHPGSLLAALGSWLLARHAGGEWWVRIEDLDPPREVAGAAERQLATLAALGLRPDAPVVRQSDRHALYAAALERLLDQGLAFACHCTRSELAATHGIHRACVARTRRRQPAIRLRVPEGSVVSFEDLIQGPRQQDVAREVGDFVLRRADGLWAYQLAVVVDDAHQGITDVVRGADLLDSTGRQILLQRALGLPVPRHAHLPLVTDADGRKLSKSEGSAPLGQDALQASLAQAWRALGQDPGALAGASDPPALLALAAARFDPARIPATLPPRVQTMR
ncbi:tRNA glutamyl-Q(34) synthetase GluQRS [Marilutibacter aestuarii]|uniref:Glutamyl-Q tRNA(Asp) synthetase n=1 Tax=Marilutibacter aestuarii TaxID=1706195 RepID=A0A508APB0_9GAMM|nr:tRNA glutamyl-Q(34) synthetase GluQRS [Lysobacter aestuarii]TQD50783.1 tRNA glutamyl-Q(34) synthetase GluQRS [Lysobacter aestuarii]